MAKLPSLDSLGERPTPQPSGGLAVYRGDVGALDEPGKAQISAGQMLHAEGVALGREADQLAAQFKAEQEKMDTLKVEDAFTKLRQRQLDLTIGEQDGYLRLKGSQATGRPLLQDYKKLYDDATTTIEAGLANDQQREKFRARAGVSGIQFQEGILQHVFKESAVYAKEVLSGVINTEVASATAQWQNPEAVGISIARIENQVKASAEALGWPKEYAQAERLEALSKVHSSVISQAIASGNYVFAQKWYEANKDSIDKQTSVAVVKAVADGEQKQLSDGYRSDFLASKGNLKALGVLRDAVMKDPKLDDGRRNALVGPIQNEMFAIERRNEARQERWVRQQERAINTFNADTLAGYPGTDPQRGLAMVNAVKGTELEPMAQEAFRLANATREFSNQVPVVQARQLAEAEAAVRRDPSKFDRKIIDAWRSIHDSQKREAEANPTGLMARQGVVELQPLDIANPNATAAALQQRFSVARQASSRFGVPVKPLQPDEVQALSNALRDAPPEKQAIYFGQLRQAAGADNSGYMSVMGQLATDNPVAAVAGSHAGLGRGPQAALILRGNAALHPNRKTDGQPGKSLVTMPPEAELERVFKDAVGDAFAGKSEQRSAAFQAWKAVYAAQAVDSPKDADPKAVNVDFAEKAMKTVLGEVTSYKGRSVIPPYGYNRSDFVDGVARLLDQQLDQGMKTQFSRDRLLELPLVNRGDGRYVFMSGDSKVVDESGREIVIDFNRGLPFRTSGRPSTAGPDRPRDITDLARRTATQR